MISWADVSGRQRSGAAVALPDGRTAKARAAAARVSANVLRMCSSLRWCSSSAERAGVLGVGRVQRVVGRPVHGDEGFVDVDGLGVVRAVDAHEQTAGA